jgi:hypothetical protein
MVSNVFSTDSYAKIVQNSECRMLERMDRRKLPQTQPYFGDEISGGGEGGIQVKSYIRN